jgi:hypothetical protein
MQGSCAYLLSLLTLFFGSGEIIVFHNVLGVINRRCKRGLMREII